MSIYHSKKANNHNQNNNNQGTCSLLATLNPGTPLNNITVDGAVITVFNFASYNSQTGLATFLNNNGDFVVANCNEVNSIEFFNI